MGPLPLLGVLALAAMAMRKKTIPGRWIVTCRGLTQANLDVWGDGIEGELAEAWQEDFPEMLVDGPASARFISAKKTGSNSFEITGEIASETKPVIQTVSTSFGEGKGVTLEVVKVRPMLATEDD